MKGIATTSPVAEPPTTPVVVAGEHKSGRVVAVGSYRLFSNYGAGLSLRNNRTFAMNIIRWLARKQGGRPIESKTEISIPKVSTIVPPKSKPRPAATPKTPQAARSATVVTPQTTAKPAIRSTTMTTEAGSPTVLHEIESLRSDISEMREIIARLYSDTLGYLQEMKEEVRSMLDYIRTKEG